MNNTTKLIQQCGETRFSLNDNKSVNAEQIVFLFFYTSEVRINKLFAKTNKNTKLHKHSKPKDKENNMCEQKGKYNYRYSKRSSCYIHIYMKTNL